MKVNSDKIFKRLLKPGAGGEVVEIMAGSVGGEIQEAEKDKHKTVFENCKNCKCCPLSLF